MVSDDAKDVLDHYITPELIKAACELASRVHPRILPTTMRAIVYAVAPAIRAAATEEAAKIVEAVGRFSEDHHGSDYAAGFSTGYNDALDEAANRIRAAKETA